MEVEQSTLFLSKRGAPEGQTLSRTKKNDAGAWCLSLTAVCHLCGEKLAEYDPLKTSEEEAYSYLT